MHAITETLLAAQKSGSARPYVHAVFSDFHGEVSRVHLMRHYTGSEGEYFSAAAGAGDGALIRARIDPATKVLYTQRVASPAPGSTFSAWTSHGTVSATGAVALAVHGSSVFLFYVDTDNLTLRVKQSTDNGATYGSPATVTTAPAPVTYLAADVNPSGERVLFWAEGATAYRSRYASGAWGARTAWTNSVASITGLACRHLSDFNVIVCGTATGSGDAVVWSVVYGDGLEQAPNVWGGLKEITSATASTNVSFRSPALEFLHAWRLFFVEKYTGTQAYARLQWSTLTAGVSLAFEPWREPLPFDYVGDYGVAAAARNLDDHLWLSSPAGVWSGSSPSTPALDVTADVMEASVETGEDGSRARLVLRNDAADGQSGRYAGYSSGGLAALRRGARLQLVPGYHTSTGAETGLAPDYWVESIEQVTGPQPTLVVHARDAWWLLEKWKARRQFAWAAGTFNVGSILFYIASRAGLVYLQSSQSDAIVDLQPAFTIHPGESGHTAFRRLLALVPDVAKVTGSALITRTAEPGDDIDYAYEAPGRTQTAEHAIITGRYRDDGPAFNRARVLGAAVFNESFDFDEIEATGERISQTSDLNLTTAALAVERAEYQLREAAIHSRRDEVRIFGVNCGQELYDLVSITDAQAGLSAAPRRVLGLSWRYQTSGAGGPRYDMTLTLGEP